LFLLDTLHHRATWKRLAPNCYVENAEFVFLHFSVHVGFAREKMIKTDAALRPFIVFLRGLPALRLGHAFWGQNAFVGMFA